MKTERVWTRPAFVAVVVVLLSCPVLTAFAAESGIDFARDAKMVLGLAERSVGLRARMVAFAKANKDTERITGDEHALIDNMIAEYGAIRIRLSDVVDRMRKTTGLKVHRPETAWVHAVMDWFRDDSTSGVADDTERLKAMLVGVAASTVLIENASSAIENLAGTIFEKRMDRPVRITPTEELADTRLDLVVSDLFHTTMTSYYNAANHDAYKEVVGYLLERQDKVRELAETDDNGEYVEKLNELVFESAAGKEFIEKGGLLQDYSARLRAIGAKIGEKFYSAMNTVSKVFGNAVGSIHIGKASLTEKERKIIARRLYEILEPGDLLLDKTSFAMTDKLIPGHFGHVAIWLGRPEQLEGLGLFDPSVNTFGDSLQNALDWRDKLMEGNCILEALRPGVVINPIEHFLDVDEVLVLRLKPEMFGGPEQLQKVRSRIVCRAMHHLGQRYDFNFDINTADTIVCSELAYQAYPQSIAWPLSKSAGRWTISPDQVAVMAGPGPAFPLDIVYYVHCKYRDGKIVGHDMIEGLPLGGVDYYEQYWKILLKEFPIPDPSDYQGNDKLTAWAKAVRALAEKYGIQGK